MYEDLIYKIAITKIPKVGPVLAKNLIGYCGSAKAVFEADKKSLIKIPGIGSAIAERILQKSGFEKAEKEFRFLQDENVQALFYLDENYPRRLKNYHDCPIMLYYKGQEVLNHDRIIAIVGTRQPTTRGKAICEEIIAGLEEYNALVVSGLAYGIDITAHKKCVDIGTPTIGVMAHGISMIYPSRHKRISNRMLEQGGLLTEFTHETRPEKEFFPMRNRIIAGMCDALVVVETANKGGSMISARMANDYSKDVFAVPGRLNDERSEGCNHLIKTHKAALFESVRDIAYILRWDKDGKQLAQQQSLFAELTDKEKRIVDLIRMEDEMSLDNLCLKTKINAGEMASLLLDLEFKGLVKPKPGKRFVLVG